MPVLHYQSKGPGDNYSIAADILKACKNVRIFALYGELGAGKTTLVKAFCTALGVEESVTSPTFTLIHEYRREQENVYHFDCYRLKSEQEAYEIGMDEILESGDYVFVEWPDHIPALIPDEAAEIAIQITEDGSRNIQVTH